MSEVSAGLTRGLSSRHIRFIALGSAIGTGLFYGSADAIHRAGPAALLAYIVGGIAIYVVLRSLGELSVRHPVAGSFSDFAAAHLGPFAGFITGWTFVFEVVVVCIADVTAVGVYMSFWFHDVPRWIWVLAAVFFIGAINLLSVKVFGELEFWFSLLKVIAIVAMIIGGVAVIVFGLGLHDTSQGVSNLWSGGGFLGGGIAGFLGCFSIVIFAFGGTEIIGITAGEAQDPSTTIPRAIKTVPVRIMLFYVLTLAVIMAIVPWREISSDNSPFVQIFQALGVDKAAAVLNVVVISAALSAVNSNIFAAGRMLFGLALREQAPRAFSWVSRHSVPWLTVLFMMAALLVGVALNYLIPERVFVIIASIATFATVFVWLMILVAHYRSRHTMTAVERSSLTFPVPLWPYAQIATTLFLLFVTVLLLFNSDTRVSLLVGAIWLAVLGGAFQWVRRSSTTRSAVTGSADFVD